jgi:hypothetical protein
MRERVMKVSMRKDLADEGINIPCLYQEGSYLDSSTIAEATYLGTLNGEGSEVVLQLARGQGGYSEIVIVMSIDLDYIQEGESNE